MSTISKELASGSYLESLMSYHPSVKPEDIWSLICCGDDLKDPYSRWSGVVAYPVYTDARPFTLFFGDFSEQLMSWENVPEFRIERSVSKVRAFSEFRTYISSVTDKPVFISANAATWALKVIQEAVKSDVQGQWHAQFICLRDLYSTVTNRIPLYQTDFVGEMFQKAPQLPRTFGLNKIADVLGVKVPELSDKATYRAQLTSECSYRLLEKPSPEDSED